jgi:hypothetical protein
VTTAERLTRVETCSVFHKRHSERSRGIPEHN